MPVLEPREFLKFSSFSKSWFYHWQIALQLCCKRTLSFFQFPVIFIFIHNAVSSILSIYLTVDLLEFLLIHAHFQFFMTSFNPSLFHCAQFILEKRLLLSS